MAIPSIAMIPSGYKANKVYSVLPTDGSGDLDFERTTIATRVNQNGLIEEVAIGVPRLDYTDVSCPSLLLEPTSTNKITQSQIFSGYGVTNVVVADDAIISPDGTLNGASVTDNNNGGTGVSQMFKSQSVDVLSDYTFSVFAKKKSIDYIALRTDSFTTPSNNNSFFDLNLGTVVSQGVGHTAEIKDYGNGWFRCSITFTTDSVDTSGTLVMRLSDNGIDTTLDLDGTNSIYTWGWQFEKQSYATSYTPTAGTAQTRTAETASKSGISSLINSEEGVLYAEISALNEDQPVTAISISNQSLSNRVLIVLVGGELRGQFASGTDSISKTTSGVVIENFNKIACSYTSTTFKVFVNGLQIGTTYAISTALVGLTGLSFDRGDGGLVFVGKTKSVQVYNASLTDAELITLTTI